MREPYNTVKSLIRTEKGATMQQQNKYLFWVSTDSNKVEIADAVKRIYKVNVKQVNTVSMRGKKKRVRFEEGKTPDWKKAIVTLERGDKIDIT